ncbi:MAG: protein-L-isoaspartate(D-aspartate) O-methyltransferase [Dehalococcoidia bacterium]|nr:protein-L-isoaspartate(D-aspartate) O-methyltransferase [Dehalococcoidia bacterium]
MGDLDGAKARLLEHLSRNIKDRSVIEAMAQVPREKFVPEELYYAAYDDRPLSIGFGQTISQPYIVALMTEALELTGKEKVLEIGTGSGYQAAIVARLARKVISVERVPELAASARETLHRLGYKNVEVHVAGKELGWPQEAPYDAIIVTAASPCIPDTLLGQLVEGGRLVIPVGSRWEQDLLKIIKYPGGNRIENLGACRFVPLIGKGAWEE